MILLYPSSNSFDLIITRLLCLHFFFKKKYWHYWVILPDARVTPIAFWAVYLEAVLNLSGHFSFSVPKVSMACVFVSFKSTKSANFILLLQFCVTMISGPNLSLVCWIKYVAFYYLTALQYVSLRTWHWKALSITEVRCKISFFPHTYHILNILYIFLWNHSLNTFDSVCLCHKW